MSDFSTFSYGTNILYDFVLVQVLLISSRTRTGLTNLTSFLCNHLRFPASLSVITWDFRLACLCSRTAVAWWWAAVPRPQSRRGKSRVISRTSSASRAPWASRWARQIADSSRRAAEPTAKNTNYDVAGNYSLNAKRKRFRRDKHDMS